MELEEFEEKMALLEPQLEMNGNITKRHLQIADEFETLCGIFWSSAKLVMDKHVTDAEEKNIEILRVIMLVSAQHIKILRIRLLVTKSQYAGNCIEYRGTKGQYAGKCI